MQCTSNVVGVIPPHIHDALTSCPWTSGRVDDHGSGISFLLGDSGDRVLCWEHATQTPSEELVPPAGPCVTLTHPEHPPGAAPVLVACLGPGARSHGSPGRAPRHAFLASPVTGVLCAWVLDLERARSPGGHGAREEAEECDASVRLRLGDGEALTALVPLDGEPGIGAAWLLAATSRGRLWKIYKTSRPPTLHAKRVRRRPLVAAGRSAAEVEEPGLVRGLLNYFVTPSKNPPADREGERHAPEVGDAGVVDEEDRVAALVPLPPPASFAEGPAAEAGRSPRRRRLLAAPAARALAVGASLAVREWQVSIAAGAPDGDAEEGHGTTTPLFPRRGDGTLDLASLCACRPREEEPEEYRRVELLAPPVACRSNTPAASAVLAVVRLEGTDPDAARVYILRIGLPGWGEAAAGTPRVVDAAWLDRHAGRAISSEGGALVCAGLVAAEAAEGEEAPPAGGFAGATAYVAFGDAAGTAEAVPVTVSAVRFPAAPAAGTGASPPPPWVRDVDLLPHVVPGAVRRSLSYDALTGGCVFLAASGLLCGAAVRFPPSAGTGAGAGAGAAETTLAPDEAARAISSHLRAAFRQYRRAPRGAGDADDAARAVVPPSVGACAPGVLSAAAVLAAEDLARDAAAASPFSPRAAASPVTVLRDKLRTHHDFVNFLAHAGALRRVLTAGRVRLRDFGEMM